MLASSPHAVSCCTGCAWGTVAEERGGPMVSDEESGDSVPRPEITGK